MKEFEIIKSFCLIRSNIEINELKLIKKLNQ